MNSAPQSLAKRINLRGLSFQEMLIVVAVFAILAIVVMFSSSQAMVRTRVSRVRQEQQTLASALAAYRTENSDYPSILSKLTAPVSYVKEIPSDPFLPNRKMPYEYYSYKDPNSDHVYSIIVSAGPDGNIDFTPIASLGSFENPGGAGPGAGSGNPPDTSTRDLLRRQIIERSYDPTNGVTSDGDIIRVD